MITNRGARIYPHGQPETFCVDHWRCRFLAKNPSPSLQKEIALLQLQLTDGKFDIIKTEHLYNFDGKPGYSSAEE